MYRQIQYIIIYNEKSKKSAEQGLQGVWEGCGGGSIPNDLSKKHSLKDSPYTSDK